MSTTQTQRHTYTEESREFFARVRARFDEVSRMRPRTKRLRAYTNWLRSNYELMVGASEIKARPLKITFDPTNVCQLRCPLCPTGLEVQDRDKGHAEFEMFHRLIEEIGDCLFFIDFFNWGEPLLNPRIEQFIRLASARNIICNMSTNLSLPLTDDRIDRLVRSGLHEIIVSLDGASQQTYETYRRRGKFDLVIDNIRRIIACKDRLRSSTPIVTWQFLVFSYNQHEIPKAKQMAIELGVDRIVFREPYLDLDRFPLSAADKETMSTWKPDSSLIQISTTASAEKHHARCGWHYMSSAINWDGSVASCCTTFEKRDDFGTMGSKGEQSYMSVINNGAFKSVRERFSGKRKDPVDLICERCPTPGIMDYHEFLNRQIALYTLVGLVQAIKRLFRTKREPAPRSAAASTAG